MHRMRRLEPRHAGSNRGFLHTLTYNICRYGMVWQGPNSTVIMNKAMNNERERERDDACHQHSFGLTPLLLTRLVCFPSREG